MSTIETTGKTIEDAVRSGLVRLGRMKEEVDIEVLEEPKSGFFGLGSKPAKARITETEGVPSVLRQLNRVPTQLKKYLPRWKRLKQKRTMILQLKKPLPRPRLSFRKCSRTWALTSSSKK